VTITVTDVEDPVVAIDDTATMAEDGPTINGNVLTNDNAQNVDIGEALTVTSGGGTTTNGGTYTMTTAGAYTYTPAANFNGTDTFNYTVGDGTSTDVGTVTVTVSSVADNNELQATIGVGSNPSEVVFSSDGSKVFVANADSDTVSVINTSTNVVEHTITGVDNPQALAINGNRLYVANTGTTSGQVSVYDLSSPTYAQIDTTPGGAINSIAVGTNPTAIAISPDGSTIYVASTGTSGQVSVIAYNSGTGAYTTTTTVALANGGSPAFTGTNPQAMVLDSANGKLFVLATRSGGTNPASVWAINTTTNALIDTNTTAGGANAGSTPITLTGTANPTGLALATNPNPAFNRLYVTTTNTAGTQGQVWVISPSAVATNVDGVVDHGLAAGIQPIVLPQTSPTAITVSNVRLYITHANGTVTYVEALGTSSTATTVATLPAGAVPGGIALNPTGDRYWITGNVAGSSDNVYVFAIVPSLPV
jgi:YVTN family beta-propeller protein